MIIDRLVDTLCGRKKMHVLLLRSCEVKFHLARYTRRLLNCSDAHYAKLSNLNEWGLIRIFYVSLRTEHLRIFVYTCFYSWQSYHMLPCLRLVTRNSNRNTNRFVRAGSCDRVYCRWCIVYNRAVSSVGPTALTAGRKTPVHLSVIFYDDQPWVSVRQNVNVGFRTRSESLPLFHDHPLSTASSAMSWRGQVPNARGPVWYPHPCLGEVTNPMFVQGNGSQTAIQSQISSPIGRAPVHSNVTRQ